MTEYERFTAAVDSLLQLPPDSLRAHLQNRFDNEATNTPDPIRLQWRPPR